jgi:uncharacterized protein (TIGR04255 family)
MKIPVKITPDMILEAIIEIRINPIIPDDAVFGAIFGNLRSEFSGYETLQALQIPEAIRKSDSNLIYAPLYKLQHDDILLQIGPRVITFNNPNKYLGWDALSGHIHNLLEKIFELKIIKSIERIGLRYINFFPDMKILEEANLRVDFPNFKPSPNSHNIRIEYRQDDITTILQVLENATVSQNKTGMNARTGSIVDIDCFKLQNNTDNNDLSNLMSILVKAHQIEKELFFSLLKPDLVKKMNPEYEDR